MSMTKRRGKSLTHRPDYLVYFVVLYPLVLLTSIVLWPFRKSYVDDRNVQTNIFNRTANRLNSTLPWLYMER